MDILSQESQQFQQSLVPNLPMKTQRYNEDYTFESPKKHKKPGNVIYDVDL